MVAKLVIVAVSALSVITKVDVARDVVVIVDVVALRVVVGATVTALVTVVENVCPGCEIVAVLTKDVCVTKTV